MKLIGFLVIFSCMGSVFMQDWYVGTVDNNKHFWTNPYAEDWLGAHDWCVGRNMKLARIESLAENTLVADYMANNENFTFENFWLGGSDYVNEGSWYWHNEFERMSFSNWYTGGSDPVDYTKNCMTLHSSGIWFDHQCGLQHVQNYFYPLCESLTEPRNAKPIQLIQPAKTIKNISNTKFSTRNLELIGHANGKYIYIDPIYTFRWTTSIWDFCHERGLNTISIESEEEIDLIRSYLEERDIFRFFATSATPFYDDEFYWMQSGNKIESTNYLDATHPISGGRYKSLCIDWRARVPVSQCSLFGLFSSTICEINV